MLAFIEANILAKATNLEVFNALVYLSSMLAGDGFLDSEMFLHIRKASDAFTKL